MLDSVHPFGSSGPPLTGFHFRVDFGLPGLFVKDVGFKSVSGISMEFNTKLISRNGDNIHIPDGKTYGDITLSRGMIVGSYLSDWLQSQMSLQRPFKIPIIITILDGKQSPIYSWTFFNAYPIKLSLGGMDAEKGQLLLEQITFKYEFYKVINVGLMSSALG